MTDEGPAGRAGAGEESASGAQEAGTEADAASQEDVGPEKAEGASQEGETPHGDRPLSEEERAELYRQQLKELRVVDIARDMMLTIVTVGYQKLGLTDETNDLRDLEDAKLAIELLRSIVQAVDGVVEADEIETYRSTLSQMQLNYARVAGSP